MYINTKILLAPTDLRAALRIQPGNQEALEELLSLIPHEASDDLSASSLAASSSGATSPHRPAPSNHNRLQLPKSKSFKPLPFTRTKGDDKKLKIVPIPVFFEVPEYVPGDPSAMWKSMKAKKVKNMSTKTESFVYPSWEKYTVKQVGG